ncbi:hypothetical protein O0L34_g17931 [Tuta absoluta]|nr:hypothetical protein O0L34_g17931 [Tuta absoluta]
MKLKRVALTLEERRKSLQNLVTACSTEQNTLNVSVQAALAGACANLHALPEKLNPVVRPLMESIKKECSEELQANSAETLAVLLGQLAGREPCPNNKVLVNLKAFLRCDPEHTPRITLENTESPRILPENGESASDSGNEGNTACNTVLGPTLDKMNGILTLLEQQRGAERGAPRRGRPPALSTQLSLDSLLAQEDESRKLLRIQRRGAMLALISLTKYFGDKLPEKLPKLWEFITEPFAKVLTDAELEAQEVEPAEELISRLQVLEVVCPYIAPGLWAQVSAGDSACAALSKSVYTGVRHMAARALAAMAGRDPVTIMHSVINQVTTGTEVVCLT